MSVTHSLEIAREVRRLAGSRALVAFSGGKDSLVTLDICAQTFERVDAFFMYLVKGLEIEERMLANGVSRYKNVTLHRIPHPQLAQALKGNALSIHVGQSAGIRNVRLTDVTAHMRKLTGAHWCAIGWRATESMHRRWHLRKLGEIDHLGGRFFPIADWTAKECVSYLKTRRIPLPVRFGVAGEQAPSGVGLDIHSLRWLADEHPADFAKVLRVFPMADAMLERAKMYPEVTPEGHEANSSTVGALARAKLRRAGKE